MSEYNGQDNSTQLPAPKHNGQDNSTQLPTLTHILCPVRGGPQSAKTVDRAIERALESSADLSFLYIVDVDFLSYATVARVRLMVEELIETGRFTLTILSEKARNRGVEQVHSIIREGSIRQVIREVATEVGATLIVIGRPSRGRVANIFSSDNFEPFIRSLEDALSIQVECVD